MTKKKILIPIPTYGSDPSEVAIPWKQFSQNNFEVIFATPRGKKGHADKLMITGKSLGIMKSVLRARKDAVKAYIELEKSHNFCKPIKYSAIKVEDFDAIYLPGGHDKSVKEYLESITLQNIIVDFFNANKSVGAVCHGVILLARSINPKTKKSVIADYKTTCLLKSQELLAHKLTKLWLGDYYLTYPGLTVEDEVRSVLSDTKNFIKGPSPLLRDSNKHLKRGFVVKDRNYISARWPGDIYNLTNNFMQMVKQQNREQS